MVICITLFDGNCARVEAALFIVTGHVFYMTFVHVHNEQNCSSNLCPTTDSDFSANKELKICTGLAIECGTVATPGV